MALTWYDVTTTDGRLMTYNDATWGYVVAPSLASDRGRILFGHVGDSTQDIVFPVVEGAPLARSLAERARSGRRRGPGIAKALDAAPKAARKVGG